MTSVTFDLYFTGVNYIDTPDQYSSWQSGQGLTIRIGSVTIDNFSLQDPRVSRYNTLSANGVYQPPAAAYDQVHGKLYRAAVDRFGIHKPAVYFPEWITVPTAAFGVTMGFLSRIVNRNGLALQMQGLVCTLADTSANGCNKYSATAVSGQVNQQQLLAATSVNGNASGFVSGTPIKFLAPAVQQLLLSAALPDMGTDLIDHIECNSDSMGNGGMKSGLVDAWCEIVCK